MNDKAAGINGGFEVIKDGIPVNWYFNKLKEARKKDPGADNDFDIISDSTDFKEGKRSLKFVVRRCNTESGFYSPGIFKEFEYPGGSDLKVSFWIKNSGSRFKINIGAVKAMGGSKEPNEPVIINSADTIHEWKEYVIDKHIPSDMDALRFDLNILAPGTFQIDDIRIVKIQTFQQRN